MDFEKRLAQRRDRLFAAQIIQRFAAKVDIPVWIEIRHANSRTDPQTLRARVRTRKEREAMQKGVLRVVENGCVLFDCPGCKSAHSVRIVADGGKPCWGFNGDYGRPTFTPSLLVTWGHYVPGYGRGAGPHCQFGCDDPAEGNPARCGVCHSFVTDGQIQFLGDCTHPLAGRTVSLRDFDEDQASPG